MRRFLCLPVLAAVVLAIPTAQAAGEPAVTLAVSSYEITYTNPVVLAGHVSSKEAGVHVTVLARPFNSSRFRTVATAMTDKDGTWKTAARPGIATTYMAKVGKSTSAPQLVGVHPLLTMELLAGNALRVRAQAAKSFKGKVLQLQRASGTGWTTILKPRLNKLSTARVPASALPEGSATLRLAMSVNQAGVGYLGSTSRPMTLPARWVSLTLSKYEVLYGGKVELFGSMAPHKAGMTISILSRPATKPEFGTLALVKSGTAGRWSFTTKPQLGTTYQAHVGSADSRMLAVGVHPRVHVRIVSGGRVWAHVTAGKTFEGSDVQLQQLVEGQWKTIAKQALDPDSTTVFPVTSLPGGTSTMRVAMSVNQAGAGYLAGFSRTFVYQR